jgi:hypothetical protein
MQTLPIFLGLAIAWPLIIKSYLRKRCEDPGIIVAFECLNPFGFIFLIW